MRALKSRSLACPSAGLRPLPDLLLRHGPSRCNLRPTSVDSAGVERSRTCSAPLPYRELGEREVAACANLRLRLTKVRGSLSALAARSDMASNLASGLIQEGSTQAKKGVEP